MWASDVAIIDAIADRMMKKFFAGREHNAAPEPPPPPFVPERPKKNEDWLEALQRRNRDAIRAGTAGSATLGNDFKPRPPRAPGEQHRYRSGRGWFFWA